MPQRTIDVRLADCSSADDTYGHLAHEIISNGYPRRASTDMNGEVPSTLQVRLRGNRRSRPLNMPIATAYLERRERKRGVGYQFIRIARHQRSHHAGMGARVCGAPPCRAEAYAASMICIIASASRNDASGFAPARDSASTRFTNSG